MLPLLKYAAQGETRVPEVAEKIGDDFGLTREERDQMLPSARQRLLHNRLHWAKSYMVKAGLLEQPRRGSFVASEQGRALLAKAHGKITVEFGWPVRRSSFRWQPRWAGRNKGRFRNDFELQPSCAGIRATLVAARDFDRWQPSC
jgi:restriction endonuclease Mrr